MRRTRESVELPADLSVEDEITAPVDSLTQCLPRVLSELSQEDRDVIVLCDIEGMTQKAYAERLGLPLATAKSRVQRGRNKLKKILLDCCKVEMDSYGNVLDYRRKQTSCKYC